jgi:hypothetical protein
MYSPNILKDALYILDFPKWCEDCLKVRNEYGERKEFTLYPEQQYTNTILNYLRDPKRNGPALLRIYKARKRGMSTMFMADLLHHFIFTTLEKWGTIYGHENSSAATLFNILRTFYDSLPDPKPKIIKDTERKLWFEGNTKIEVKSILGGGLSQGDTPDYLIMTEVSLYKKAKEIMDVMSGLAMTHNLTVVQESRSNGYDDYWYPAHQENEDTVKELCLKHAREITLPTRKQRNRGETPALILLKAGFWPKDKFFHIFIPWFWNDSNHVHDPDIIEEVRETLTDYEESIIETYDLELSQIAWYRSRASSVSNNQIAMKQHYPCSVEESFISSGNCFFDVDKLSLLINRVESLPTIIDLSKEKGISEDALIQQLNVDKSFPKDRLTCCDLEYVEGTAPKPSGLWYSEREKVKIEPHIKKSGEGGWYIFNPPVPNWIYRYLLINDPAEAKQDSDDDSLGIWDMEDRKFVALRYGRIGVDALPEVISKVATWYNFADALVERNGLGQAVLIKLRYLYLHVIGINRNQLTLNPQTTSEAGIAWNGHSKETAALYLKEFVEAIPPDSDGSEIPFKDILIQMTYFQKSTLRAEKKKRDDLVAMCNLAMAGERALREAGRIPKFLGDEKIQKQRAFISEYEDTVPSYRCY